MIADACGHPDCATVRTMLGCAQRDMADLVRDNQALQGEVEGWKLDCEVMKAKYEYWHTIADERAAEITRLRQQLAIASSATPKL